MRGNLMNPKGRNPGMAKPHVVPTAKNFKGQGAAARSSKTSAAGGFTASRRKGSLRGER